MNYHVMINIRCEWILRKEGAKRAIKNFGKHRTTARQYGRAFVLERGGKLYIHRPDGMVDRTIESPLAAK